MNCNKLDTIRNCLTQYENNKKELFTYNDEYLKQIAQSIAAVKSPFDVAALLDCCMFDVSFIHIDNQ